MQERIQFLIASFIIIIIIIIIKHIFLQGIRMASIILLFSIYSYKIEQLERQGKNQPMVTLLVLFLRQSSRLELTSNAHTSWVYECRQFHYHSHFYTQILVLICFHSPYQTDLDSILLILFSFTLFLYYIPSSVKMQSGSLIILKFGYLQDFQRGFNCTITQTYSQNFYMR